MPVSRVTYSGIWSSAEVDVSSLRITGHTPRVRIVLSVDPEVAAQLLSGLDNMTGVIVTEYSYNL